MFADAATRISIFLSPLDVHINRVPVAERLTTVQLSNRGNFSRPIRQTPRSATNKMRSSILRRAARAIMGVVQIAGVVRPAHCLPGQKQAMILTAVKIRIDHVWLANRHIFACKGVGIEVDRRAESQRRGNNNREVCMSAMNAPDPEQSGERQ